MKTDINGKCTCKKSIIKLHIKSVKHHNGNMRLQSREEHKRDIGDMIQQYDQIAHPVGENLPAEVRILSS